MSNVQRRRRPHNFKDLSGQKFNRLFVIRYHGQTNAKKSVWWCRCDCGTEKPIIGGQLISGHTKSCGCLESETTAQQNRDNATHGMTLTPEWKAWKCMIERCYKPKSKGYRHWGGRGVKVCPEWRASFQAFFDHIGPKPSPKHSLDRFPDTNGDYTPGNVRWATATEQIRNRRTTRRFLYQGEMLVLTEIAQRVGLPYRLLHSRLLQLGWTIERATSTDSATYHHRKEP